jgi:hypothetical protein
LVVPVVSIPVLLVLKLLAWVDRKHEKRDAADIHTLLKEYGDAGNEHRLYGEELNVLEAEGYDFELAGARLIGHDAARVISPDTRNRVRAIALWFFLRPGATSTIAMCTTVASRSQRPPASTRTNGPETAPGKPGGKVMYISQIR